MAEPLNTAADVGSLMPEDASVELRKTYHQQLDDLNADVLRLAAMASEAIQVGTEALLNYDLTLAEQVVVDDSQLDQLADSIEERTYGVMARQAPMASDLRVLVTNLRAIHELERIGDLMVNIAKAARRLHPSPLPPRARGLIETMREQATSQLRLAIDAFGARDPKRAAALRDMDDVMDDLQKQLLRVTFDIHNDDENAVQLAVQLAFVGRYFERIADHAVNIGERVDFVVSGVFHEHAHVRAVSADKT